MAAKTPIVRVGLIGAARIAPRAIIEPARRRADIEIRCVAARDRARARAFAEAHAIPHVAHSYADLIARDDLDLIYVGIPSSGHAEWSIRALEAGKAVLCEKPFAMSAGEARAMVAAAARAGRPLLEAYHYRFHAAPRRVFALAAAGAVGRVTHIEARFDVPIPYAPDELRWLPDQNGGALMDLGCYAMHAARMVAGAEPEIVAAEASYSRGVDAWTRADLAFPGGLRAAISCSMVSTGYAAPLVVRGEDGDLRLSNFVLPHRGFRLTRERAGEIEELAADGPPTYDAQLAHVLDVLSGRAEPLTGGADAIATMEALDAVRAKAVRQIE